MTVFVLPDWPEERELPPHCVRQLPELLPAYHPRYVVLSKTREVVFPCRPLMNSKSGAPLPIVMKKKRKPGPRYRR